MRRRHLRNTPRATGPSPIVARLPGSLIGTALLSPPPCPYAITLRPPLATAATNDKIRSDRFARMGIGTRFAQWRGPL